tara:strand:- start:217 stop:1623 length:1407 start_codon:yes stop_codon:yes gene_type:complete
MNATTAAIINTLYSAGPDLTLAPKDMVNDVTRRATAIDLRFLDIRCLDKRGQESCGHDEYDGVASQFYNALSIPKDIDALTSTYKWLTYEQAPDGTWEYHESKIVRFDSREELAEPKRQHILNYVESLKADYMTDTDWSGKGIGETTTRDERLDWMLQRWDDADWVRLLSYKMFDDMYGYKGECAWKDDKSKRCTHHDGRLNETILMYYKNTEGKYISGRTAMIGTSLRKGYTQHYLDELEDESGKREAKFIKSLVCDETVLSHIKACIPKMKTESRDWLLSNYTTSEYKLKDENEPDVWANRDYYKVKHGKRGHYQLTWWRWFKQDDERKRKEEEQARRYEEDQTRHGLEVNGWKFHAGQQASKWRPINPVIVYEVAGFRFLQHPNALRFAHAVEGWRVHMVGPKMEGKHGAVIDVEIKEVEVKLWLRATTDPKLYAPHSLLWHLYINSPLPENYYCTQICTHVEEE